MTDDFEMRMRLQRVAEYRDLRQRVRRSGRENVVFAVIMLCAAYFFHSQGAPLFVVMLYTGVGIGELLIGLFKWAAPSAECLILDGLVLLAFAALTFGREFLLFRQGQPISNTGVFFGLLMLYFAVGRFKSYAVLRRLFAERPNAEQIAWFDELIAEIKVADPQADELALDLPTSPHWKAKLLGATAFFVTRKGNQVLVAGPYDFEILREKVDLGTGRRKAILQVLHTTSPEFQISDATWSNYLKWRATNPLPPVPSTAVGGRE